MEAIHLFRRLYSLDTLDTRLTTSSHTPLTIATEESSEKSTSERTVEKNPANLPPQVLPAKWRTPEFCLYFAVITFCLPLMFRSVMKVSRPSHPNYPKFEGLLSPGWIPGRKIDNSDSQYSSFRENIPYMAVVVLVQPLLRRVYNVVFPSPAASHDAVRSIKDEATKKKDLASADDRFVQRSSFDLYFALIFLAVLHGFSALKILLILYINFNMATRIPKEYIPTTTWVFNIGILFVNEFCHGYHYARVAKAVFPFSASASNWGNFLDTYGGLVPRWEILFNFTILRLISFNMDYYWSLERSRSSSPVEKKQLDPSTISERDRVTLPAAHATYRSFRIYLSYTLYSPLYLAGPILTFNDYISQTRHPSPALSRSRTSLYAIRFLLLLLCMELLLHYIYTVAICASSPNWHTYTPFQLSNLGYFNLQIIWLKLLIPFRFFRLWALLDGMDPPENVVRCMSDNYSTLAFWRGWHRSFNRWIVRYIYVPLGGGGGDRTTGSGKREGPSKLRGVLNTLAVFTFVALWHDINLRLLMWGWLITLFVVPEILATMAFPAWKWKDRPEAYRVLCGIGAVGNILMMMAANLVGFAIGIEGLKGMVRALVGTRDGLAFLATACVVLFMAVQVMFECRESERRRGIRLKF
ncbi:hypothetical protein GJ744_010629 [Endocarpon pusillum]|uniref:Glycerol uptake protein 1 n=1 Tax=Endocarpon pusillum TaxID=364733 RepID=A0A8H7AQ36_9EURO|nr:hypothetical protein GJ744_010629 [Endocarpon pusillum]